MTKPAYPVEEVRDDLIPLADYLDPEFAALEAKALWPKVWQQACRLEEIEQVGSFVVYEILSDSILVVRTGEGESDVTAMHNVCPHRGTLLAEEGDDGHCREEQKQPDLAGQVAAGGRGRCQASTPWDTILRCTSLEPP